MLRLCITTHQNGLKKKKLKIKTVIFANLRANNLIINL